MSEKLSLKAPKAPPPGRVSPRYIVDVRLKSDFSDAEGAAALALLHGLGLNTARDCRVSQLYELRGPLNQGHIHTAARELLCDQVTQEFRLASAAPPPSNGMNRWRVEVWLKDSVTDTVGESVSQALRDLGLPPLESVRRGKAYLIGGKCNRTQLENTAARCLANPVVHRLTVSEEHP